MAASIAGMAGDRTRAEVASDASVIGRSAKWPVRIWLAAIVIVGAVLRFVGITFGFPLRTHPDEWAIVDAAVELARRRSFEPTTFFRPDHLEIKLNLVVDSIFSQLRYGQPFEVAWEQHQLGFVLIGRIISALFGVGCVVLAFLIVRRVNVAAGLVAAGLVAVSVPQLVNAHYATPESPQAFFTLLLIWFSMRYLADHRLRWAVLAAASVGMAFTIKYPAIISSVMVAVVVTIVAVRQRSWRVFLGHGAASVGALIAGVYAVSPVLIIYPDKIISDIQEQNPAGHLGADGLSWSGNALFYVNDFLASGGVLLGVAAVGGALWALWRKPAATLPLWVGVIYWLGLSAVSLHWSRWGVPMYLSPLLFAAIGIQVFVSWMWRLRLGARRVWMFVARGVVVAAVGLFATSQIVSALAADAALVAKDTRVAGIAVGRELGAKPANTLAEGYTTIYPDAPKEVFGHFVIVDGKLRLVDPNPKIKYVIVSSGIKNRYLAEEKYSEQRRFYEALSAQAELVREITPAVTSTSKWEPWRIVYGVQAILAFAHGGLSGPALDYYDISSLPRG
jgi:4-amino-4-deoxy-L-arabinose transferase-like glycosyltransferase